MAAQEPITLVAVAAVPVAWVLLQQVLLVVMAVPVRLLLSQELLLLGQAAEEDLAQVLQALAVQEAGVVLQPPVQPTLVVAVVVTLAVLVATAVQAL